MPLLSAVLCGLVCASNALTVGPAAHPLFSLSLAKQPKNVQKVITSGDVSGLKDLKGFVVSLPLSRADRERALAALKRDDVRQHAALTAAECDALVAWAAPRLHADLDSVDGAPSYQTTVAAADLAALCPSLDGLLAPAAELLGSAGPAALNWTAFVRRYSAVTRPRLPFHCDTSDVSTSVALSTGYAGGDLLLLSNGGVVKAARKKGAATHHSADVAHAVSDVKSGERWSLVLFHHRKGGKRAGKRSAAAGPAVDPASLPPARGFG